MKQFMKDLCCNEGEIERLTSLLVKQISAVDMSRAAQQWKDWCLALGILDTGMYAGRKALLRVDGELNLLKEAM